MSFSATTQEMMRKGVVWIVASAITGASAAIVTTTRDDAVHTQQIAAIQQTDRALATAVNALNTTAEALSINVARLNQEMRDQRLYREEQQKHADAN